MSYTQASSTNQTVKKWLRWLSSIPVGNLNRSEHHYLIHNPPNMLEWGTFRTLVLNHWGNMNLFKLNEIYRYSLKDNIHKVLQTIS